jgi:TonB family protein
MWSSALVLVTMLFCAAPSFAEDPICRSRGAQVKVVYPDLARRMKIMGIVRLDLQLNPSGSVREIKVLGGNPVLVSAAQDAVKQARFEGSESCIVVFQFK